MVSGDKQRVFVRCDVIKLGVSGALGKMGQRILTLAAKDKDFRITLPLERPGCPGLGIDCFGVPLVSDPALIEGCNGLIEFSSIEATLDHLAYCAKFKKPIVIGTTGFSETDQKKIRAAAKKVPVVFSPNMSIGVNLLFGLVREAASKLPSDYTVTMTEAHHVHKKDAPSGTAKFLAGIVRQERGQEEVSIKSIREGEIIGDHEVVFKGPHDVIRMSHSAKTRDIFAKGALEAMKFAVRKKNGIFNMSDVLKELSQ
jgi:4-hydroxy-tetrahydrodipicolinate reductase